jgi:hypothetical protein
MQATYQGITFSDTDIVNADDFIPHGESNPHNVHPYLLHDHGTCLGVVFADNLQDAWDIAVDSLKLTRYRVDMREESEEWKDYGNTVDEAYDALTLLGNNCIPHDIETLSVVELPNPAFSFVALFTARFN